MDIEHRVGRRAVGLTQEQLAEHLGVATETIGRLERGSQLPSLHRLEAAAHVLGVDLADIFRQGPPKSKAERAIARLMSILRARPAEDVELLVDIAERIFARWP